MPVPLDHRRTACLGLSPRTHKESITNQIILQDILHVKKNFLYIVFAAIILFIALSKSFRMPSSVKPCLGKGISGIARPRRTSLGTWKMRSTLSACKTFDQVKAIIDDWIDYYNNDRYQWQLAKLSPMSITNTLPQESIRCRKGLSMKL